MGHWPSYEVRVQPISDYNAGDTDKCKATFYLGTSTETNVPKAFLADFFTTQRNVAWVGFGANRLDKAKFTEAFGYSVAGELGADTENSKKKPGFYQTVTYKGSTFTKGLYKYGKEYEGAFSAVDFEPAGKQTAAPGTVLAEIIHSKTRDRKPYILRHDNKFAVGDIPFSYMHEGDRYFVFADLMFDILGEKPRRSERLAFVRLEDIYGQYEQNLLKPSFSTLKEASVPISFTHIPLFADPFNALGYGATKAPKPASAVPEFVKLIDGIKQDPRNAIIWHGTTHQLDNQKNPYSGASGDDYEFWDAVHNRPIANDSVQKTLDRLKTGLAVYESYGVTPRYWVAPHYKASALDNVVFSRVFPWVVGRVSYYATSVGNSFVLPAAGTDTGADMPGVTRERLNDLAKADWGQLDKQSKYGEGQLFPFEIYRDIYGQRVIPETLNYISLETTEQDEAIRDVPEMLADAKRNLVVRDYWASFFIHPYLFNIVEDGGGGKFAGDTTRLKELVKGLRDLGYTFVGLSEFEEAQRTNKLN